MQSPPVGTTAAAYEGSCLCGGVRYALSSAPRAVTHCHCRMCQKQHGAAFATYGSVPCADLRYTAGETLLSSYESSPGVWRRFCGVCGASVEWRGGAPFADWVSIALAALDTPFQPASVKHAHLASAVCWWQDGA